MNNAEFLHMQTQELESLHFQLADDVANIKSQIDNAKMLAKTKRIFADDEWLTKAQIALRHKGRLHQAAQVELARRRRQEKQNRIVQAPTVERNFMNIARAILPADKFQSILDMALEKSKVESNDKY
jgi:hypothetical protein